MSEQIDKTIPTNEACYIAQLLAESAPQHWPKILTNNVNKVKAILSVSIPNNDYAPIDIVQMKDGSCLSSSTDSDQQTLFFVAFDSLDSCVDTIYTAAAQSNEVH
jgi:hypothetical protein